MLNSDQIEIRHLRYFLAVADELHFRRAAESLFLSQSNLSRQIKQLEEALGAELFVRHNRKVELTPAGELFREEAGLLLRQLDNLYVRTNLLAAGEEGEVRIGYIGSAMQNIIPDLMVSTRNTLPRVHFSLKEMENPAQLKALLDQRIDLGFVRVDRVPRPLSARAVYEDTFSLVLPGEHPAAGADFKGLRQFQDEPFILFEPSYSSSYYEKMLTLFDEAGFTPSISHRTVNAASIYRLVENGFGLSIVPTALTRGYAMNVCFVELNSLKSRTTLRAVWNEENRNPLLSRVVELLPMC